LKQTHEPREVIDFKGFENITIMDTEECSIALNFKVNTSRGHYYFYAESKRERETWINRILAMMTAFYKGEEEEESSLSRTSSLKSVRSFHSIASTIRS